MAPLPSGVASDSSHANVTHVYWRRHCWRGRWGHLHCY
jgi:hypothetical protein